MAYINKIKLFWTTFSSIFILLILFPSLKTPALVEPNVYQEEFLQTEINLRISQLFGHWKIDDYQFIYNNLGDFNSKKQITLKQFSERMLQNNWVPYSIESYEISNIKFIGLLRVLIDIKISFQNRRDSSKIVNKSIILNLNNEQVLERRMWQYDLLQIIDIIR